MIRAALAAILISMFLSACGGGGGSSDNSSPQQPSSPPAAARTDLVRVGYFGVDGDQIAETADHVSFEFLRDDGTWSLPDYDSFRTSTDIVQMQEAKARGVSEAWVSIGYLVFTMAPGCTNTCYSVRADAIPRLLAFKAQLDAVGVADMVTVLYPADEPELRGLSDAKLLPLLAAIHAAWHGPKLAVIYGDTRSYPGLAGYDLAGKDDYGRADGVLEELPPIVPPQQNIIIAGGAGPWRNDPRPFCAYAVAHAAVYAIVGFTYYTPPAGAGFGPGIRDDGMLPAYKAMAMSLKQSLACPQ